MGFLSENPDVEWRMAFRDLVGKGAQTRVVDASGT